MSANSLHHPGKLLVAASFGVSSMDSMPAFFRASSWSKIFGNEKSPHQDFSCFCNFASFLLQHARATAPPQAGGQGFSKNEASKTKLCKKNKRLVCELSPLDQRAAHLPVVVRRFCKILPPSVVFSENLGFLCGILQESGPEKGVITKGVFSLQEPLESLKSLKSLNSLESLENGRLLLCFPQSGDSQESLESLKSLESLENGDFSEKTLFLRDEKPWAIAKRRFC